jgi:heptosyltransferase III
VQPNPKTLPRVLVIRGGAIGDFILTLPVLTALRGRFPNCRLELLGYPHIAQLALAGGLVDAVRPIESRAMAGFFAAGGVLDAELTAYFAGCALILSYLYDPDGIFERNVRGRSAAQFLACPHRPDESRGRHATGVFLEPLERLAIFDTDPVPRLRLEGEDGSEGGGLAEGASGRGLPWVALHPGSGSERKNWPESSWATLIGQILEERVTRLLLVGGEAEGDRLERLQERFGRSEIEVARSLPLVELAKRMASCQAFVGHDSGITHLAAALGLPGLVLWGPTCEGVWRPRSERILLLRAADGLAALSVSTVREALRGLVDGLG